MLALSNLLILAGAVWFAYKLRMGVKLAAIAALFLAGVVYVLQPLQNPAERIDSVTLQSHEAAIAKAGTGSHANCPRVAGEQPVKAIETPENDPNVSKNNLSMDLLESLTRTYRWTKIGHVEYFNSLAMIYEQERDYGSAFDLYKEASDEGNAYGQFNIGRFYLEGLGTLSRPELALRYFERAATQNLDSAQYNLGYMYAGGIGVNCNISDAITWWTKAGRQGNNEAINALGLADKGHSQDLIHKRPIDIDFTNPAAVIDAENDVVAFASHYDEKRSLDASRRNTKIDTVTKACSAELDRVAQAVRENLYTQFDGIQSWRKCYPQAESQLF
jgi:tetratricopeptide (TPR) repeat protein